MMSAAANSATSGVISNSGTFFRISMRLLAVTRR
jgi:hypothetical protein